MDDDDNRDKCIQAVREVQTDPTFLIWKYSCSMDAFIYYPAHEERYFHLRSIYVIFYLSGEVYTFVPRFEDDPGNNTRCNGIHGDTHPMYKYAAVRDDALFILRQEKSYFQIGMVNRFKEFKNKISGSLLVITTLIPPLVRLVADYFMFS